MNLLSILHFENIAEGIMVTVIGFGVVFAVLIFISLILMISGRIFAEKSDKAAKEPITQTEKATVVAAEPVITQADDKELIAVIAAAVSAYEKKPISPDRLVVRRLRRVTGWNKEALAEQQSRLF